MAPTSDRVRPGRGSSASGGLAGARLHGIASLQLMSSATRQVVCLQDFALSKRLEHAELRGCYRVRPDLPTNCGSPAWRATTTSSSLRDISSGAGTRRSNRSPADHPVVDTPSFREALKIKAMGAPGISGECLRNKVSK